MSVDDSIMKSDVNISPEVTVDPSENSTEIASQVKTRKELSLKEKLEILKQYDKLPKMSQRSAAIQLNVSQPVLCKILKNRNYIENMMLTNKNSVRKRTRGGKERDVESALKLWYAEVQERNIPINRHIIREKAKELAKQMGKEFAATDGWFTRWRKRENIACSFLKSNFNDSEKCSSEILDKLNDRVPESCEPFTNNNITDSPVKLPNLETIVPNMEGTKRWEMQNENICEVFIKTEPEYDCYETDKRKENPPTDEEMLEALRVLRTGVKFRTNNLQLHYEYENFIYKLLKKVF